jgi:DNA-3-methyladenine glycosylase II
MNRTRRPRGFVIHPVPPFRLDFTAWVLRRRSRNLIDRWDGTTYRRVIRVGRRPVEVALRQAGSTTAPRLIVTLSPELRTASGRRQVKTTLDRLLGLRIDLSDWYHMADRDARLGPLAERFRGVKPTRFPSIFEALINAFACQQLSLEVGLELLNRLAILCAATAGDPKDYRYAFPEPHEVAGMRANRLRALGFSRQKVLAIMTLVRAISRGTLDLETLADQPDGAVREQLLALRGVGRWTAEYVLLRGLGRLHVFPGDDVGAQKRLAQWLGYRKPLDYAGVHDAIARWQPFAGMVYFHLLLDGLAQRGALQREAATR